MRLDSPEFLVYFALLLLLDRTRLHGPGLLLCAAYLFYAASASSWIFLPLLVASTVMDFGLGLALQNTRYAPARRVLLLASIAGNLGTLGYFKYGPLVHITPQESLIPLGISFYSFQKLGYVVDVYRRQIPASRNPLEFALFAAFFPQLTAGPIARADSLLAQIARRPHASAEQALQGLELCLVGLFKKLVLAESFAQLADTCLADPARYSGAALLTASFAFSAQLYCDFSAYTTLARGLAKLLGYELPENFGYPLLARDPIEFRRNWHITMGEWFRDYLYRPLGGDRGSPLRTIFNTLVTWSAFGLWHGASWTFLAWGFLNGALLCVYRVGRGAGAWTRLGALGPLLLVPLTPLFVVLAHSLFRAPDLQVAGILYQRMFTLAPGESVSFLWAVLLVASLALHALSRRFYREDLLLRLGSPGRYALVTAVLAAIYLLGQPGHEFYYRQF